MMKVSTWEKLAEECTGTVRRATQIFLRHRTEPSVILLAHFYEYVILSQVFRGNVDNNTPYANSFTPPIKSQYVRLYPQVCRRHCTLRMELLGCELSGGFSAIATPQTSTTKQCAFVPEV